MDLSMAASSTDDLPPGIEERYTSATHTSNMKVDTRPHAPRGPADTIIAAGWSHSRIGASLLRLHSEWDGCEKPQRPTEAQLELLACTFKAQKNGLVELRSKTADGAEVVEHVTPRVAATRQADQWHQHELGLLFQKLKSLPTVREQLTLWCLKNGITAGVHTVAPVLRWWLDPTCPACEGQKWQLIPGTRRLSNRTCTACRGSGEGRLPRGAEGRKLLFFMNECLSAARASMRNRFKHQG